MAEALGLLKRHFGPQALILSTRTVNKGGWLGMGGKPYIEITAAPRLTDLPETLHPGTLRSASRRTGRAEGAAGPMSLSIQSDENPSSKALLSEVGALKSLVQELVRQTRRTQAGQYSGKLYDTYLSLVENAVAEELAAKMVDTISDELSASQLRDPRTVQTRLVRTLKTMLPTAGPIRFHSTQKPTIVALVGPTGVGKTTTIAKLAAILCLREHRKVGLITIDTYRIAAVEQLKTYAQIIDVPLEVAMSPKELADAAARLGDRDCILIDTAGRSQRDEMKMKELRGFFTALRPHEIHLVLSGTSSNKVLNEAIEHFKQVGIDRVIFTKLDEALGFGVMLGCLQKAQARLSYVTTGQDVPDDIEVGQGDRLAKLILGGPLSPPAVAVAVVAPGASVTASQWPA